MDLELGIVLIGPPGVGKGTQAARLREAFELDHVSTGDLLRQHRAEHTALGQQASAHMAAGRLVPDDLVVEMVRERIVGAPRFLLDGFPRTLDQARALTAILDLQGSRLTAAIALDAADDVVTTRITGRADGRDDDQPHVVRERLAIFRNATSLALAYYATRGELRRIDGAQSVESVFRDISAVLAGVEGRRARTANG